jgi:hypothetical protein
MLAGVPLIPKFASECAATYGELGIARSKISQRENYKRLSYEVESAIGAMNALR